jgi:hypothetical protein
MGKLYGANPDSFLKGFAAQNKLRLRNVELPTHCGSDERCPKEEEKENKGNNTDVPDDEAGNRESASSLTRLLDLAESNVTGDDADQAEAKDGSDE